MKRRSIYDWKVAFLFLCILVPVAPVYLMASSGGWKGVLVSAAAGLLIAAVVAERVHSLFFHHVLATCGGMLWSSRRNMASHARSSLIAVVCAALSVLSVVFQGAASLVCLALSGAAFLVLLWSVLVSSRILCLYPASLQYGAFLYDYEDMASFDLRDTVLDLDMGNAVAHCVVNEGEDANERLRAILGERCR